MVGVENQLSFYKVQENSGKIERKINQLGSLIKSGAQKKKKKRER